MRLSGLPRTAKLCTEINSSVTSSPAHVFRLLVFRLDSFRYVPASLFIYEQELESAAESAAKERLFSLLTNARFLLRSYS